MSSLIRLQVVHGESREKIIRINQNQTKYLKIIKYMACNKNQKPEELKEEQLEEVSGGRSRQQKQSDQ